MQVELYTAFHMNREDIKDETCEVGDLSQTGDCIGDNCRVEIVTMHVKASRREESEHIRKT